MPVASLRHRLAGYDGMAERIAWAACLALPLALLHARAAAEVLIAIVDLAFLTHAWTLRDAAWLRTPFARAAALWWVWLTFCSAIGTGGLLLALLAVRLPVLSVAVGHWLLLSAARRRLLWYLLAASLVWIGVECWQQALTGHNLFGQLRWGDGALTGPFNKPRAGPAVILLFFPVIVPASLALFAGGPAWRKLAGAALVAASAMTMLLIGQRMPSVLMMLGLGAVALLVPRLRRPVLAAGVAGILLVAALPVLSPATQDKLVVQTADQLRHFADSDYGLIFGRATKLAERHPWAGLGFDAFRRDCADLLRIPRIPDVLPPPAVRACNIHPHNYYLEAADNAGLPGLLSFGLMAAVALVTLGRGLWRQPEKLRVGLFVAALVAFWPAASTSAFTSMPNGGWVFLLLGFGIATADAPGTRAEPRRLSRAGGRMQAV